MYLDVNHVNSEMLKARMKRGRWKAVAGIWQFGSKILPIVCQLPPCHGPICLWHCEHEPGHLWILSGGVFLLATSHLLLTFSSKQHASCWSARMALPPPRLRTYLVPSDTTEMPLKWQRFVGHSGLCQQEVSLLSAF